MRIAFLVFLMFCNSLFRLQVLLANMTFPTSKDTAFLTNGKNYSFFSFGGDVIRFATPSCLRRYVRVKRWEDGYLEVDADYGNGEVEDYIDIRQILENLYYDADSFLRPILKVEVRNV